MLFFIITLLTCSINAQITGPITTKQKKQLEAGNTTEKSDTARPSGKTSGGSFVETYVKPDGDTGERKFKYGFQYQKAQDDSASKSKTMKAPKTLNTPNQ